MLYKSAKTDRDFPFLFFSSSRCALEVCEDHQGCQLQTEINYNLEDDPIRLHVSFFSPRVCVHLLSSAISHIFTCTKKKELESQKARQRSWESEAAH